MLRSALSRSTRSPARPCIAARGTPGARPAARRAAARRAGRAQPSPGAACDADAPGLLRGMLDASAAAPSHARPAWLPVAWLAAPALLGSDLRAGQG